MDDPVYCEQRTIELLKENIDIGPEHTRYKNNLQLAVNLLATSLAMRS